MAAMRSYARWRQAALPGWARRARGCVWRAVAGVGGVHGLAAVAHHFAGLAGTSGGVAVQADSAQRDAARRRLGDLGQVAVALAAEAAMQRRRRRALRPGRLRCLATGKGGAV